MEHFHFISGLRGKVPDSTFLDLADIAERYNDDRVHLQLLLFGVTVDDINDPRATQDELKKRREQWWEMRGDPKTFLAFDLGEAAIADRHYRKVLSLVDEQTAARLHQSAVEMLVSPGSHMFQRKLLQNYLFHDWLELTPAQLSALGDLAFAADREAYALGGYASPAEYKAYRNKITKAAITILRLDQRLKLFSTVTPKARRAFVEYRELPGDLFTPNRE